MQIQTVPRHQQSVLLSSVQGSCVVPPNKALKRTCLPCHVWPSHSVSSRGSQAA